MLASDILDMVFFPMGMILMMDGSWTDGRGGWYICDGRDTPHGKTPNLADRFIRGGASAGGTGGGSATLSEANLPSHNHSLSGLTISGGDHLHGAGTLAATSGAATHSHTNGTLAAASGAAEHSHGNGTLAVTITGGTHGHTITDPGHTHNTSGGTVGVDYSKNRAVSPYESSEWWEKWNNNISISSEKTDISIADTTGSHSHTVSISGSTATDGAAHEHGISGAIADTDATHGHSINGSTASTGHSHEISGGTIGNTGSGTAFNVEPAYYTMIYIKKMV
jgi:hypothetical protein